MSAPSVTARSLRTPGRPSHPSVPRPGRPSDEEAWLVERLKAGDDAAFARLVDRYHAPMVRLALTYVSSRAVAEEIAQDVWMVVVAGIERFEARSSIRTWLFRILANRARSRGKRERRCVPISSLLGPGDGAEWPAFASAGTARGGGSCATRPWAFPGAQREPEEIVISRETLRVVREAIEALPPLQRRVILLRDVEGWTPAEVCELLGLSDPHQRVVLHRARCRVRTAVARYLQEGGP